MCDAWSELWAYSPDKSFISFLKEKSNILRSDVYCSFGGKEPDRAGLACSHGLPLKRVCEAAGSSPGGCPCQEGSVPLTCHWPHRPGAGWPPSSPERFWEHFLTYQLMRDTCVFSTHFNALFKSQRKTTGLAFRPVLDPPPTTGPAVAVHAQLHHPGPGSCRPLCAHTLFPLPMTPFPALTYFKAPTHIWVFRTPLCPPLDPQWNLLLPTLARPAQLSFNRIQSHTLMYYPPSPEG